MYSFDKKVTNPKPGLIPPAADRKPQFPVMPLLFGAASADTGRPIIPRAAVKPIVGLYGNDKLSNCSSVAIANGINGISALLYPSAPQSRQIITTANVNYFYSRSTGYDPSKPGTDRGADADTVARMVQMTGYPTHSEFLFPAIGEVEFSNIPSLRHGLDAFGVLNLGVGLSINDIKNDVWVTGTTPDDRMGSYGYHMLNLWDYEGVGLDDPVTLLSFGRPQQSTWRWVLERTVVCYGHAYHQLLTPCGQSFDHQGWTEYLQNCRACSTSY